MGPQGPIARRRRRLHLHLGQWNPGCHLVQGSEARLPADGAVSHPVLAGLEGVVLDSLQLALEGGARIVQAF